VPVSANGTWFRKSGYAGIGTRAKAELTEHSSVTGRASACRWAL